MDFLINSSLDVVTSIGYESVNASSKWFHENGWNCGLCLIEDPAKPIK
jgi:hypothetical protein